MLVVNDRIKVPLKEFDFSFARSQGPGGQNVNKVNTKATLRWPVGRNRSLPEPVRSRFVARYRRRMTKEGDFLISSQRFRDRGRNIADCLAKLRDLLEAVATRTKNAQGNAANEGKCSPSPAGERVPVKKERAAPSTQMGRLSGLGTPAAPCSKRHVPLVCVGKLDDLAQEPVRGDPNT